jgi:hypothetical protein
MWQESQSLSCSKSRAIQPWNREKMYFFLIVLDTHALEFCNLIIYKLVHFLFHHVFCSLLLLVCATGYFFPNFEGGTVNNQI